MDGIGREKRLSAKAAPNTPNKRSSQSAQDREYSTIRLTPAQRKQMEEEELRKCRYRENQEKNCIVVEYENFPLFEIPMSYFKDAKDFRDIPRLAEKALTEIKLKVKPKEKGDLSEDQNK